ncbi:hypothetical protein COT97_02045 [Candidatus Falkowbacteria bacterium CG10_big_fil_rev_8_21_14_0_10_39_11]|uniref:Haloacid dehalogenase-like hydrolase n=1 Tax=Candidatus Falkowbacteria bacterium CG10_big_fil_rev_8_21_14_0_10_39_11 TaxID=1974565 RepID=A0A2H0V5A8_9BACT|nr:MAG: hypothetical protein COT97_02045 [Candidatus Falkowbacteria bacterium CG10_big_fil_rev_8_21_14_0_10_39_11]
MKQPKGVLLTDFDGTVKRNSIFLDIVHEMVRVGLLNEQVAAEIDAFKESWEAREGSFDDYMMKAVRLFEANLAGVAVSEYDAVVERVLSREKNNLYRFSRALIQKKIDDGWFVCGISASPESAVKAFARAWGMHEAHGTKMFKKDGVFTGERTLLDREGKQKVIRGVLERFPDVPRAKIWACGDTTGDFPMLMMPEVGTSICINPSADLMKAVLDGGYDAVTKTWFVIERKDVIYEFWAFPGQISRAYRIHRVDTGLLAGNSVYFDEFRSVERVEIEMFYDTSNNNRTLLS